MRRRSTRAARAAFCIAFVSIFTGLPAGRALAQLEGAGAAGARTPAPVQTVDVTIGGGGDEAALLLETLRELLGRLGLAVTGSMTASLPAGDTTGADSGGNVGGGSDASASSMSVQIDLVSRLEAVAIVRSARGEFRRTIARDASPSIVREEIGETVRSAVESQLLTDEPRARPVSPRVEAPAALVSATPVAAPPRETARFGVDVTTRAGAGLVADGAGVIGRVGGGVIVASRRGLRPSVTATGEYAVPFDMTAFGIDARTSLVALRAVAAVEVARVSWLALEAGAGGGVDVMTVVPTAVAPAMVDLRSATRVDPVLAAVVTALVPLTPGVALTLGLGADVDVASVRYRVQSAAGTVNDAVVPWRIRPIATAGFTFTAFGGGLFASRGAP